MYNERQGAIWRGSVAPTSHQLTFAVVAKGHLGLPKANGVFSGANAIELFELGLLDVLSLVRLG